MSEEGYLRAWAESLELENHLYISQLNNFEKTRGELNLKKLILTEILVRHREAANYNAEEFKSHFGLELIESQLKQLQAEEQLQLESELQQKIHFNSLVLERIKTISQ